MPNLQPQQVKACLLGGKVGSYLAATWQLPGWQLGMQLACSLRLWQVHAGFVSSACMQASVG